MHNSLSEQYAKVCTFGARTIIKHTSSDRHFCKINDKNLHLARIVLLEGTLDRKERPRFKFIMQRGPRLAPEITTKYLTEIANRPEMEAECPTKSIRRTLDKVFNNTLGKLCDEVFNILPII